MFTHNQQLWTVTGSPTIVDFINLHPDARLIPDLVQKDMCLADLTPQPW